MSFSDETQRQIEKFAKEQSAYYLESAEMSILDRLKYKSRSVRSKTEEKIKKITGDTSVKKEASDDMYLFMSDYISDLTEKGMDESEAFEKAKSELAFSAAPSQTERLQKKYEDYYENIDPAYAEAVGLYYGAGVIIGAACGFIAGIAAGPLIYKNISFAAAAAAGTLFGVMLGIGFGMLKNASLLKKNLK